MKGKLDYAAFDNFAKQGLVSPVIAGDVFVELYGIASFYQDEQWSPPILSFFAESARKKGLTCKIEPLHGTIAVGNVLGEEVIYNKTLIHSAPKDYCRHDARTLFSAVQINDSDSWMKPQQLGQVLVLRCLDQEIVKNLQKFILIYKNMIDKNTLTPFGIAGARHSDVTTSDEQLERLEFFRAFRVFVRLSQEQPEPITKSTSKSVSFKGVSCSGFVSYMFKAAIIAKFFPKGLPDELMLLYKQIEEERKTQKPGKKLDKVNPQLLEQFEKLALTYLDQKKPSPESQYEEKEASTKQETTQVNPFVKELKRSVKNANIKEFTHHAVQSSLWNAGIYCINKETQEETMISYKLYQKAVGSSLAPLTTSLNLTELCQEGESHDDKLGL